MDDKMVGILVIGGVGIIFMIGLGIYQQYRATKRKETWDWLANEFGLTHMWDEFQQDGVLEGDVGGRHVQARTGTYKKSRYTEIRVDCATPLPPGLAVSRADLFSTLFSAVAGTDVKVGHDEFDRTFIVKANNAEDAERVLRKNADALLALKASVSSLSVDDKGLVVDLSYNAGSSAATMVERLIAMLTIAVGLETASGAAKVPPPPAILRTPPIPPAT